MATEFQLSYTGQEINEKLGKIDSLAKKSEIPTSLPASDVYDWAKASTKPTYTASEVGAVTPSELNTAINTALEQIKISSGISTSNYITIPASSWKSDIDSYVPNQKNIKIAYNDDDLYIGETIAKQGEYIEFRSPFTYEGDSGEDFIVKFSNGNGYTQPYDISNMRLYRSSDLGDNIISDNIHDLSWSLTENVKENTNFLYYSYGFDEDRLPEDWHVVYTPTTQNGETVDSWSVADGKLNATATHWNALKNLYFYTGDASWTDYAVQTAISITGQDPRGAGVFVRATDIASYDKYNGYYVEIEADQRSYVYHDASGQYHKYPMIVRVHRGNGSKAVADEVATFNIDGKYFTTGTQYTLKVLAKGNTLRIYIDGAFIGEYIDTTETTYATGYVGINQYMSIISVEYFDIRSLNIFEENEFEGSEMFSFTENFDNEDAFRANWDRCFTYSEGSHWNIYPEDGVLAGKKTDWKALDMLRFFTGDPAWADYAVESKIKFHDNMGGKTLASYDYYDLGVFVRASNLDPAATKRYGFNGYYVAIDAYKKNYMVDDVNGQYDKLPMKIKIYKATGEATADPVKTFEIPTMHVEMETYYTLKVLAKGNTLIVYVDDIYVGQWTDTEETTYETGYVGINQYRSSFKADYFTVRPLNAFEKNEFESSDEKFNFTDNFDGDVLSNNWHVVYTPTTQNGETVDSWYVADGKLNATATNWNALKNLYFYTGDASWKDYVVETNISIGGIDPRGAGVFVRATDITSYNQYNGYYVEIETDKRSYVVNGADGAYSSLPMIVRVWRGNGSKETATEVATFNIDGKHYVKNTQYKLSVIAEGRKIIIYLDGIYVGYVVDSAYMSGYVGINQYMSTLTIDSFAVRSISYSTKNKMSLITDDDGRKCVRVWRQGGKDNIMVSANTGLKLEKGQDYVFACTIYIPYPQYYSTTLFNGMHLSNFTTVNPIKSSIIDCISKNIRCFAQDTNEVSFIAETAPDKDIVFMINTSQSTGDFMIMNTHDITRTVFFEILPESYREFLNYN